MLARENRLLSAADFRGVLRRGQRLAAPSMVLSLFRTAPESSARFGFVVTRKVGNAVTRNRVRRRLKAVARELVDSGFRGADVVVRALPGSANAEWTNLREELSTTLEGR